MILETRFLSFRVLAYLGAKKSGFWLHYVLPPLTFYVSALTGSGVSRISISNSSRDGRESSGIRFGRA